MDPGSRLGAMSRLDKRGGLDFEKQGFFSQSVCSFEEFTRGNERMAQQPGLNQQHATLLHGLMHDTELQFQQYVGEVPPASQIHHQLSGPGVPARDNSFFDLENMKSQSNNIQHNMPKGCVKPGRATSHGVAFQGEDTLHERENKQQRQKRGHSRAQTMPGVSFAENSMYNGSLQDQLSKSFNINSKHNARPRRNRTVELDQYSEHSHLEEAFLSNPNLNILDGAQSSHSPTQVIVKTQTVQEKTVHKGKLLTDSGNSRPIKQRSIEAGEKDEKSPRRHKPTPSRDRGKAGAAAPDSRSLVDWDLDDEVERRLMHDQTSKHTPNSTPASQEIIYINNRPFQILARDPNYKENVSGGPHVGVIAPGGCQTSSRMAATATKTCPLQSQSVEHFQCKALLEQETKSVQTLPQHTTHVSAQVVTDSQMVKAQSTASDNRGHITDPLSSQSPGLHRQLLSQHEAALQTKPSVATCYDNQQNNTVDGSLSLAAATNMKFTRKTEPGVPGSPPGPSGHVAMESSESGGRSRPQPAHAAVSVGEQHGTTDDKINTPIHTPAAINTVSSPQGGEDASTNTALFTPAHYHYYTEDREAVKGIHQQVQSQVRKGDQRPAAVQSTNIREHGGQGCGSQDTYATFTTSVDIRPHGDPVALAAVGSQLYEQRVVDNSEYSTTRGEDILGSCCEPLTDDVPVDTMTKDIYNTIYSHHASRQASGLDYTEPTSPSLFSPMDDGVGTQHSLRPKSSKLRSRAPPEEPTFAHVMEEAESYNKDDLLLELGDLEDTDSKIRPRPKSSKGRSRSLTQTELDMCEHESGSNMPPNSPDYEYVKNGKHQPTAHILTRRQKDGGTIKPVPSCKDGNDSDVDGEIEILDLDFIDTVSNSENTSGLDPIILTENSTAWKQEHNAVRKNSKSNTGNNLVEGIIGEDEVDGSGSDRPMTPRLTERELCDFKVEKMHSIKKAQKKKQIASENHDEEYQVESPNSRISSVHSSIQDSHSTPSPIGPEILYNHFGGKVVDKYRNRATSDVYPVEKAKIKYTKSRKKSQHANSKSSKSADNNQTVAPRKLRPLLKKSGSMDRVTVCTNTSDCDSGNGSARDLPDSYLHAIQDMPKGRLPSLKNASATNIKANPRENPLTKASNAAKREKRQTAKTFRGIENSLSLTTSDLESPPDSACDLEKESNRLEREIAKLRGLTEANPRSPRLARDEMDMDKFFNSTSTTRQGSSCNLHAEYLKESARSSVARSRADLVDSQEDLGDPLFDNKLAVPGLNQGRHKVMSSKMKRPLGQSKSMPTEAQGPQKSLTDLVNDFQNVQTTDM